MHILTRLCAVALAVGATACGPSIEITKALEVTDVTTGWFDAGITNGMNKLVPSLTFKARNVSNIQVESVQFNAVFRVVDDPQELGSALVKGIDRHGIAPGASTPIYTMQSALGYTGDYSFEPFSPAVQRLARPELLAALKTSLAYLRE